MEFLGGIIRWEFLSPESWITSTCSAVIEGFKRDISDSRIIDLMWKVERGLCFYGRHSTQHLIYLSPVDSKEKFSSDFNKDLTS